MFKEDYSFYRGEILGFSIGISDGLTFTEEVLGEQSKKIRICMPSNVTGRQVVDVLCKHFRDNPEQRHYSAASTAWPCD